MSTNAVSFPNTTTTTQPYSGAFSSNDLVSSAKKIDQAGTSAITTAQPANVLYPPVPELLRESYLISEILTKVNVLQSTEKAIQVHKDITQHGFDEAMRMHSLESLATSCPSYKNPFKTTEPTMASCDDSLKIAMFLARVSQTYGSEKGIDVHKSIKRHGLHQAAAMHHIEYLL